MSMALGRADHLIVRPMMPDDESLLLDGQVDYIFISFHAYFLPRYCHAAARPSNVPADAHLKRPTICAIDALRRIFLARQRYDMRLAQGSSAAGLSMPLYSRYYIL